MFWVLQAALAEANSKNMLAKMMMKLTTGISVADLEAALVSSECEAQAAAAKVADVSTSDRREATLGSGLVGCAGHLWCSC